MRGGLSLDTNIERCLQSPIFRTLNIATRSSRYRLVSRRRFCYRDSRIQSLCNASQIASPSVGHVDWMLLGRCTGTSAPSFARPIADDQEPVSLSTDSTVTVYLPYKKVFLLIVDLHQCERSKTLACAFSNNVVAYKLEQNRTFCCLRASAGCPEVPSQNIMLSHGRW